MWCRPGSKHAGCRPCREGPEESAVLTGPRPVAAPGRGSGWGGGGWGISGRQKWSVFKGSWLHECVRSLKLIKLYT